MPPPDAETLELRSQLEGLVGKLKAKQEEVPVQNQFKQKKIWFKISIWFLSGAR